MGFDCVWAFIVAQAQELDGWWNWSVGWFVPPLRFRMLVIQGSTPPVLGTSRGKNKTNDTGCMSHTVCYEGIGHMYVTTPCTYAYACAVLCLVLHVDPWMQVRQKHCYDMTNPKHVVYSYAECQFIVLQGPPSAVSGK